MDDEKKGRIELLIEKFIADIQDEFQQEYAKREPSKLIKSVSAISPPPRTNSEIDKKISDIESLIKKLQGEITNISIKSQESDEGPLGSIKSDPGSLNLKDLSDDKTNSNDDEEDCESIEQCTPKDVNVNPQSSLLSNDQPLKEASMKFDEAINQLLNVSKKINSITPTVSEMKSAVNRMLDRNEKKEEEEKVEKVEHKDGLEELIQELKSEIAEKLEELKDVHDPCEPSED